MSLTGAKASAPGTASTAGLTPVSTLAVAGPPTVQAPAAGPANVVDLAAEVGLEQAPLASFLAGMGATEQFPLSAFAECSPDEIEAVIQNCKVPVNGAQTLL